MVHGIGHLVGIDVHDPWDYSKPLEKGMVFTIEPGIYLPEENIGVRIEDVVYVDADGKLVDLIAKLPHEASEIEAAMRKKTPDTKDSTRKQQKARHIGRASLFHPQSYQRIPTVTGKYPVRLLFSG